MSGHPTNGYKILGILLGHAPNGQAQALMSQRYNDISTEVHQDLAVLNFDREIEKIMVGILLDGLTYGNWPWSVPVEGRLPVSTPRTRSYRLLKILQEYAPNVSAQRKCLDIYIQAQDDSMPEEYIEYMMASSISDGLKHGNWPWNMNKASSDPT